MSYSVTQQNILNIQTDAAVISVENPMSIADGPVNEALAAAGGEELRIAVRKKRFLPVGSAVAVEPGGLPFKYILVTAAPRWWSGEANELVVLHCCYTSLYRLAEELGCRSVATAFLSTSYFGFPKAEAVGIALSEAARTVVDTVFVAEDEALKELSGKPYRRPKIVSYLGYYRDHAAFLLDNGQYAKVDIRAEMRAVSIRPYLEACYFEGRTAPALPLPDGEVERLRVIYETMDI